MPTQKNTGIFIRNLSAIFSRLLVANLRCLSVHQITGKLLELGNFSIFFRWKSRFVVFFLSSSQVFGAYSKFQHVLKRYVDTIVVWYFFSKWGVLWPWWTKLLDVLVTTTLNSIHWRPNIGGLQVTNRCRPIDIDLYPTIINLRPNCHEPSIGGEFSLSQKSKPR